ncbi:MAG: VTT domain-containing protein [bacterium]|nr:VTT domain-containing protein [bacterium]
MATPTFYNIFKILAIPISLLLVYLSLLLLWKLFGLPSPETLAETAKDYFNQYGLIVIFIAALIEGVLIIGQYFPGGFIIFLGVISAAGNVPKATAVVLIVCLAFFISYYINYLMGKYGWYKLFLKFGLANALENAKQKLSRHVFNAILSSYWEPSLASITATAAGVLQIPARVFLSGSIVGIIIWNTVWGIVVYFIGDLLLKFELLYILIIFVIWCAIILAKVFIFDKRREFKFNSSVSGNIGLIK